MSASTSRLSYKDCFEIFDKVLEEPTGLRVKRKDYNAANNLSSRLQYARKLDRQENRLTYEEGDPLYCKSIYDPIMITKKKVGNTWYVVLVKTDAINYEVESLTDAEDEPEPMEMERRV